MSGDIEIRIGASEQHRDALARLYLSALRDKLEPFLGSGEKAEALLRESLCLDRVIVALQDGQLLGVAGFEHQGRGALDPSLASMWKIFGWSGVFRLLAMALLERSKSPRTLLMDGLAVIEEARGRGIGSCLLAAVEDHARALGKQQIRLDVIDTNPHVRRLYERCGFRAVRTRALGVLRVVFSFAAATEMRKDITA